jgi:hypothetical protein
MKPYHIKDEYFGVEVCLLLFPTDRWHYNHLFIGNLRQSKTFIWHPSDGLVKEVYFNL